MEIAIVDDVEQDRRQLEQLVQSWGERTGEQLTLSLFDSGEAFLEEPSLERFSILLMDLYMKGINGMETARELRKRGSKVQLAFITSSDAYAVQGYEVDAANYLLKPVDPQALERTLERCLQRMGREQTITVTSNRASITIPLSKIIWIEAQRNALLFHTDGGPIKSYMTIEHLSAMLEKSRQFLLCCKGIMVNMDRIASVGEGDFVTDSGENVPIRKRGGSQVKRDYLNYLFSQRQA